MKRALAIIDFEPAARGGHFREWSAIIGRAASRGVDCVGIYVVGLESVPIEVAANPFDPKTTGDIILFDLETVLPGHLKNASNASKLSFIMSHLVNCSGCDNVAAFVLWAFDLSTQNNPTAAPWGGIGVLSAWARSVVTDSTKLESELYQFAREDKNCRVLLVWDKFVLDMPPIARCKSPSEMNCKIRYLPDLEDVVISSQDYVPRSGTLKIGLVGMLWGYRGVNLLAAILEKNEDIDGYVAGQLKPDSFTALTGRFLAKGRISLGQTEQWISNAAFNKEISEVDALVIDARSYPPPSGVALRALAYGRCIIASPGPSWTNDVIARYQCGLIVDPLRLDGLSDRIRLFYESGGSQRCRKAANDLMSQEEFSKCLGQAIDALFD
jgi:hypothetical protein